MADIIESAGTDETRNGGRYRVISSHKPMGIASLRRKPGKQDVAAERAEYDESFLNADIAGETDRKTLDIRISIGEAIAKRFVREWKARPMMSWEYKRKARYLVASFNEMFDYEIGLTVENKGEYMKGIKYLAKEFGWDDDTFIDN